MLVHAFIDGSITGGAWGKKGDTSLPHAWSGWVVKEFQEYDDFSDWVTVGFHSVDVGQGAHMSGNVAEYMALRSVLHWLKANLVTDAQIVVFSDSQLVVNQMKGNWRCLEPNLVVLRDACRALARSFPSRVSYEWIRREKNKEADFMSKCLQAQYGGRLPTSWAEVEAAIR